MALDLCQASCHSAMAQFFQFETDFVTSLRCIPMQVRYNLDSCGVKLKLDHWNQFTTAQKQALVDRPCNTTTEAAAYGELLQGWVTAQTGAPAKRLPIDAAPAWLNGAEVPEDVLAKSAECGLAIAPAQWRQHWAALTPLQRFALIKLSRPSHENRNFVPALEEFGLI
jgi:hypothetical protein